MPLPTKKEDTQPKSAKLRIYEELKQWIIDGTLQPGERISEQEIAKYFSVSRTPVHEAVQLLADQQLIRIFPGRETLVAPIDPTEITPLYRISAELHTLALDFAYPKISEDVLAELRRINESLLLADQQGNNAAMMDCDRQFHTRILQLADNHFLSEFTSTLQAHIERIQCAKDPYYSLIGKGRDPYEEHKAILEALEQHDLPTAKEASRKNWLHTIEVAEKRPKQ